MRLQTYFSAMSTFQFPQQTLFYSGKVRDVYTIADKYLVMVASDRISAFDVILPYPIPFKGQVLNQIAAFMLRKCADVCPNWLIDVPAAHISIGHKCVPIKLEMVVRGNLVGHAWRTYSSGKRELCGVSLPEGLNENDFFPEPIITPSTKADEGHDMDISEEEILRMNIVTPGEWSQLKKYSLALFERGKEIALSRGLILADTKYEFGKMGDEIMLMDEIHTPDSSRYFYSEGFVDRQLAKQKQQQLSKEFVREWLILNDFMGKEGQTVPEMSEEWIKTISAKYIELYEKVIGEKFKPESPAKSESFELVVASLAKIGIR
jgi:phosphoribosylaminoimidazole-succinocarboxamide synthase